MAVGDGAVDPAGVGAGEPPVSPAAPTGTLDRQLVRLLADMVLATELEVQHAR